MTSEDELGRCIAMTKDGNGYKFALSEAPRLLADWTAGRGFFTGHSSSGERVTVKLAVVESVVEWSPEAIRQHDEWEAERRAERITRGEG